MSEKELETSEDSEKKVKSKELKGWFTGVNREVASPSSVPIKA